VHRYLAPDFSLCTFFFFVSPYPTIFRISSRNFSRVFTFKYLFVGESFDRYVLIDAHVLSTPTLADVDGDGHVELILAVSYFFDKKTGASAAVPPSKGSSSGGGKEAEAGSPSSSSSSFDPRMYVAGGVVCYDLALQSWSWTTHLDLTTDYGKWKAYVLAAPTVADLDGDGAFEVSDIRVESCPLLGREPQVTLALAFVYNSLHCGKVLSSVD